MFIKLEINNSNLCKQKASISSANSVAKRTRGQCYYRKILVPTSISPTLLLSLQDNFLAVKAVASLEPPR